MPTYYVNSNHALLSLQDGLLRAFPWNKHPWGYKFWRLVYRTIALGTSATSDVREIVTDVYHASHILREIAHNINRAMIMEETPEGYEFWEIIRAELRNMSYGRITTLPAPIPNNKLIAIINKMYLTDKITLKEEVLHQLRNTSELVLLKKWQLIFSSSETYQDALRKRGFIFLGSGVHSSVYAKKGSNRVIKISRYGRDAWPEFAIWSTETKQKYGCRMHSFIKRRGYYVAIVERVITFKHNATSKQKQYMIKTGFTGLDRFNFRNISKFTKNQWMKELPGLYEFLMAINEAQWDDDLHDGNWGFRSDGSIVIFDPTTRHAPNKPIPTRWKELTHNKKNDKLIA